MTPGQQHRGASSAAHDIGRDGHDQAESGPGGAGEDDRRHLAENPPRGPRAKPFGVVAHHLPLLGYMEDMSGRWAWRGNRSNQADDPAPGTPVGTVSPDNA